MEEIKPSHLLNHDNDWIQQKTPTKAQSVVADQTGLPLPSEIVATVIDGLLAKPVPITDFVRELEAAAIVTRIVGGKVSEAASLPGFINPTLRVGRKRRVVVMLKKVVEMVAARGAELLAYARRRLDEISGKRARSINATPPPKGLATTPDPRALGLVPASRVLRAEEEPLPRSETHVIVEQVDSHFENSSP